MKLPWPDVLLPRYRTGRHGRWSLDKTFGCMPGYFTPELHDCDVPALKRREGGVDTVWMSLAWMERESHMPHIAAAHGHTVVMGLGMGFYLYNILHKPEVEAVTVVERDKSVVDLFPKIVDWGNWPNTHKVRFDIMDARAWRAPGPVDYMYCDFWKHLADSNALPYTMQCVEKVRPRNFGYWTQEFDFVNWVMGNGYRIETADAALYNKWADKIEDNSGSRLMGRDDDAYALLSIAATLIQSMATFHRLGDFVMRRLAQDRLDSILTLYSSVAPSLPTTTGELQHE